MAQPPPGKDEGLTAECEVNGPVVRYHRSKDDFTNQKPKSSEAMLLSFVCNAAETLKPTVIKICE